MRFLSACLERIRLGRREQRAGRRERNPGRKEILAPKIPLRMTRSRVSDTKSFPVKGSFLPLPLLNLARMRSSAAEAEKLLDALNVTRFGSVHLDFVPLVYKRRNLDNQTGFERRGLHNRAGRRFLKRGFSLNNL